MVDNNQSSVDEKFLLQRQRDETYENIRKLQEEFELQKVREKIQSLKDELKSENVAVLNNVIGRSHEMLKQVIEKTIPAMENLYKEAESDLKTFINNRWKFSLGGALFGLGLFIFSKKWTLSAIKSFLGIFFVSLRKKDVVTSTVGTVLKHYQPVKARVLARAQGSPWGRS
jgi:hypothetical protein